MDYFYFNTDAVSIKGEPRLCFKRPKLDGSADIVAQLARSRLVKKAVCNRE